MKRSIEQAEERTEAAPAQRAAAPRSAGFASTGPRDAAPRASGWQATIEATPRMQLQRRTIEAVFGRAARRGPITPTLQAAGRAGGTTPLAVLATGGVAQRKMGFEFESGNTFIKDPNAADDDPATPEALDRKDVAYGNGNSAFRLEADSGHNLEFVTQPYDNWPALAQAITGAKALADTLEQRAGAAPRGEFSVGIADGFTQDGIWMRVGDPAFRAAVQSTEGVALGDLSGMIDEHLEAGDEHDDIHDDMRDVIGDARANTSLGAQTAVFPNVKGMLLAMVMYIDRARTTVPDSTDGPKASFRLMARTDFRSMFRSLTQGERDQLKLILYGTATAGTVDNRDNTLTRVVKMELDSQLFRRGYLDEGAPNVPQKVNAGPTLRAWLSSITTAAPGRDVLSPPPGYTPHSALSGGNKKFRYGMGAMGMDGNLALFEMRGYSNLDGWQPKNDWEAFAQTRFDRAARRNTSLTPRMPPQAVAPVNAQPAQVPVPVPVSVPQAPIGVPQVAPLQQAQHLQQQAIALLPVFPAQPAPLLQQPGHQGQGQGQGARKRKFGQ